MPQFLHINSLFSPLYTLPRKIGEGLLNHQGRLATIAIALAVVFSAEKHMIGLVTTAIFFLLVISAYKIGHREPTKYDPEYL